MEDIVFDEEQLLMRKNEEGLLPTPFDPLRKYLSEVSRYHVLSRDEEFEVAK